MRRRWGRLVRRGAPVAMPVVALAVVAVLMVGAAPATAQEPGLTFVGGLAYMQGGPGPALTDELSRIGLEGTQPAECHGTVCSPAVDFPFYYDEGLHVAVLLGARYRFPGPLSIEALLSNGQRGHAEGYSEVTLDHMVVQYTTFMLSGTVGVHLGPVRLAAGPVLNTTGWEATLNASRDRYTRSWVLGGTVGASAEVRIKNALVAVRLGVQQFPAAELTVPVQTTLQADYRSILIGITASPLGSD